MRGSQRYTLSIRDLFTVSSYGICGAEAVVAIYNGSLEIDRSKLIASRFLAKLALVKVSIAGSTTVWLG